MRAEVESALAEMRRQFDVMCAPTSDDAKSLVTADVITFTALINAHAVAGDVANADRLFRLMRRRKRATECVHIRRAHAFACRHAFTRPVGATAIPAPASGVSRAVSAGGSRSGAGAGVSNTG